MRRDFIAKVVEDRIDDAVIRNCAAGNGQLSDLRRVLRENGVGRGVRQRLDRLMREKLIMEALPGFYVPRCPHCGEPFLNVLGAEH